MEVGRGGRELCHTEGSRRCRGAAHRGLAVRPK